jgi:serine/threonine-protein kinase
MIDDEGTAKIMDFGIARFLGEKGLTGEGMIIGTLEYMSPEQLEGKEIDRRSDIYSLGIILYEMVTGRVPFEGDTPFTVGMKHKSETPENPKKINPQLPDDLTQLILKCVEKEKGQRYQTVDQILGEINTIEEDLATSERETDKSKRDTEKTVLTKWKNSIAVLPFADLSPQKDQEYFCDGISEEIINSLTKIKELRVVARTSAFSFKGRDVDVREIGKKLNVESILEGSVRKAGNRLRINAQLIHVEDDYHIWSERYDRELDDVFAIQDEITQAIVKSLKVKLFGEEKESLVKRHTDNPEAHSLYLKGRYFWNKRTEGDLKKAISYFEKSIELDPEFAVAFVGLADSYNLLPWYSSIPLKEIHPKAREAVEKALELDETLAEAHASLALFKWIYDWDWTAAEEEFKKAMSLNPGYASAYHWYFEYLATMEKLDEAISIIKKAQKYDPLSLIINSALGWGYYFVRQYDRAIEQSKKTLEMNPNFFWALYILGISHLKDSNSGEALKVFQKASRISKEHPLFLSHLGVAFAWTGDIDKARDVVKKLEKRVEKKSACSFFVALIFMALDDKEKAFEWLERAYKDRDLWLLFIKVDPLFDSLRSDPRFKALLKKINLA